MIYALIESGDDRYVKIGFTYTNKERVNRHAAQERMVSLQCGNPRELVCVAMCDGSPLDERVLHVRFAASGSGVRGQWPPGWLPMRVSR
jgi:hypothetical protein